MTHGHVHMQSMRKKQTYSEDVHICRCTIILFLAFAMRRKHGAASCIPSSRVSQGKPLWRWPLTIYNVCTTAGLKPRASEGTVPLLTKPLRTALTLLLAVSIATPHALPVALAQTVAQPSAAPQPPSEEACQAGDERAFQAAIEAITISALEKGVANVDYKSAVDQEWRRLEMDKILDKRVDLAIEEVQNETSLGTRIQSLGNKDKAQELATAVAERVYRSEAVSGAIEQLAEGVGRSVGTQIELATKDASEPALRCLRAFLGTRYGTAVASAVSFSAAQEFNLASDKGEAHVNSSDVLKQSSSGITGAAILIVRRQLANMAQRIGQRIVGAVLSRLVSVVAGGIGLVLIAKDIWELRNGVLPIISDEMKSVETKTTVRDELAKSLSEQIAIHVKEIGRKSAERVIEIWHEFRRAHLKALELAEKNADFKVFLGNIKPEAIPRLDEVTAIVLASEGESGILKRLENGTLETAVHSLPEAALTIARETRNLEPAIAWSAVAGDNISKVVEYEVYQRAQPQAFTQVSLGRLFALEDRLSISRLAAVERSARDTLFDLNPSDLKSLARSLGESELTQLSAYLTGLKDEPRERVLRAVSSDPGKMRFLASPRVRYAVLDSADQAAAVDMFLRTDEDATARATLNDFVLAWERRINLWLLWERHPLPTMALGFVGFLVLLLLYRLFSPRGRRRPPSQPAATATT